jgi:hypothetical protein
MLSIVLRRTVVRLRVYFGYLNEFLGALAKLREATISVVMSVCFSACPPGTNRLPLDEFSRNLILSIFRKYVEKIQILLRFEKDNGYFA